MKPFSQMSKLVLFRFDCIQSHLADDKQVRAGVQQIICNCLLRYVFRQLSVKCEALWGASPLRTDGPGLFTTDYGFSSSCSVVWLTSYSSRVDSAMRGSSISFLTRASIAWLGSCFGSFLCILALCHESRAITGQLGTRLAVSELSCSEHFCTVRTNLGSVLTVR